MVKFYEKNKTQIYKLLDLDFFVKNIKYLYLRLAEHLLRQIMIKTMKNNVNCILLSVQRQKLSDQLKVGEQSE